MKGVKVAAIVAVLLLASRAFVSAQTGGSQVNAELALRSLQEAFPDRVGGIAFTDGDWTIRVSGKLFFWAGGKLLPENERHDTENYSNYSFYTIPERPPVPADFSPQQVENLRERGTGTARRVRKDVNQAFQFALYGGEGRREIEALQRKVNFLGFQVTVHRDLVAPLERVEAEIRKWKGGNAFIATLGNSYGFSWRQIAETQRMSYHSWGMAVDILPKNLGGRPIFWQWERDRNPDWMLVPLERRWSPPPEVVDAFKRNGFIWGGNWIMFDNMHFEFRPELIAYTRQLAAHASRNADDGFQRISEGAGSDLYRYYYFGQ